MSAQKGSSNDRSCEQCRFMSGCHIDQSNFIPVLSHHTNAKEKRHFKTMDFSRGWLNVLINKKAFLSDHGAVF